MVRFYTHVFGYRNSNHSKDRLCGQVSEFLATDTEVPGSFPGATRFSEKCLERGPLSFVRMTEEALE
jgi:hypothetical protein